MGTNCCSGRRTSRGRNTGPRRSQGSAQGLLRRRPGFLAERERVVPWGRRCRHCTEPRSNPGRDPGTIFPALVGESRSAAGAVRGSRGGAGGAPIKTRLISWQATFQQIRSDRQRAQCRRQLQSLPMCAAIGDEPAPGSAFRAEAREDLESLRQCLRDRPPRSGRHSAAARCPPGRKAPFR